MTDLHVAHWHQRYEVEHGDAATEERLARVGRSDVITVLDQEVHRLGAPPGEWCIRSLRSRTEIEPNASDAAIAEAVAASILDAITAATDAATGSEDVCHYPTRRAARRDCVRRLAAGDPRRWWAWRQLDLVSGGEPHTPDACLDRVVALLGEAGAGVTAELAILARAGRLLAVANRIGQGWERLATAIATSQVSSNGSSATTVALRGASPDLHDEVIASISSDHRAASLARVSAEIRRRSQIAEVLDDERDRLDPTARRGLALCAIAEAEPDLLRRLDAAELTSLVTALSTAPTNAPLSVPGRRSPTIQTPDAAPQPFDQSSDVVQTSQADARADQLRQPSPADGSYQHPVPTDDPEVVPAVTIHGAAAADVSSTLVGPGSFPADDEGAFVVSPQDAHRVKSEAAGLLFLLNLVDDGWLDQLWASDRNDRGLRWWLRCVAGVIVEELGLPTDDAAVAAFGGLAPGTTGATGLPEAEPVELADASRLATGLLARATERLDLVGSDDLTPEQVVLRPATIEVEGAWIEAAFALSEADSRIRRAGLDLDPGWLPWLGCVVRFRYV